MKQEDREILFLEPECKHNIWGGTRLREQFGYNIEGEEIGECWGISAHHNGDGTIAKGSFAGMHLSEMWAQHPEYFGNLGQEIYPLLVKIIDAEDDLSIQVHPDDIYAGENENGSLGKTECWYILDCPKDATLVIGHHARTREELAEMIKEGRWSDFISEVPVKRGDLIQIDPGTVHAIKGGCLILETQQSSDITYRVYDYDRLSDGKPRELHIDKSLDVIQVPAKSAEECIIHTDEAAVNSLQELYACKYYRIFKAVVQGDMELEQNYPFLNMSVVEGKGSVNGIEIHSGSHFILPAARGRIKLQGDMTIIASTVA